MKLPIYMDYHATTPIDPRVLEAMMPYLTHEFGNAASISHSFGWNAQKAVDNARHPIAALIGADAKEIVFTSGATEANNTVIKGVAEMYRDKGNHIITQVTEHKAILDPCKYLEKHGFHVTYLPVDSFGLIKLEDLEKAITEETILISIMMANNEIGTIQPIAEIGKIAKSKGIIFHTDAAQAAGKIPVNVDEMGIDLLSHSAHKLYGPKGVGILYVREKNPHVRLVPQMHGGGHERGFRSGTLNVPSIVGFGRACEIAKQEMFSEAAKMVSLRERLRDGMIRSLDGVSVNGHPINRLPSNLNLSFAGIEADSLIMAINEEIAVSTGSACSSASTGPSHVLKALGLSQERIQGSIRFGLGRFNTEEEVDYVTKRVVEVVKRLRSVSPLDSVSKPS